ncbi:MAG: hypothetical protein ACD_5C00055G0002 [uncultured bacterium]|nr:MAG: hypothetical protein ACD_5C00055G0002 [uncultured bacterium]
MPKSKIKFVLEEVPSLTVFGIWLFEQGRGLSRKESDLKFKNDQKALLNNTENFEKACQWLAQIEKIETINEKRSSYGLKHLAEKKIGYITNGVFIAAAIYCGFKYKIYRDDPNPCFAMSEKSIKQIEKKFI